MGKRRQGQRASVRASAVRRGGAGAGPVSDPELSPLPELQRGDVVEGRLYDGSAWFERVRGDLSLSRATELLQDGADVAIDPCGCGGFCGYDWIDAEGMARIRRIGGNRWRRVLRRTVTDEWRAEDGRVLLLLNDVDINDL